MLDKAEEIGSGAIDPERKVKTARPVDIRPQISIVPLVDQMTSE